MSTFTSSQAKKASAFALQLMRERRFFLHEKHGLDPNVFAECIELDVDLRESYKRIELEAVEALRLEEARLGLTPPTLERGQSMVRCSLYGGGLDICRIDPLQELLAYAPDSFEELEAELLIIYHGGVENITPGGLPWVKAKNKERSERIWKDICELRERIDGLAVLLLTRFDVTGRLECEALAQKVEGFANAEHGLAHLFYKRERERRIIPDSNVIFWCAEQSSDARLEHMTKLHLVIHHWKTMESPEPPNIARSVGRSRVFFAFVA